MSSVSPDVARTVSSETVLAKLAFYRCYSPRRVPLATLVTIAGTRWSTEIARLLTVPLTRPGGTRSRLSWSAWRRCHQHTARTCHYRRQADHDP